MATSWKQRLFRPETGFFLALWLWFWQILAGQAFLDPGTLWHSAVGDRMIETGQLIETDPFSFTFAGQPWLPHQWLAELIEAVLYRLAGWDGLLLAAVALLAWLYAWVGGRFVRNGCHWLVAVLVLAIVILASKFHFVVRPHLITIALLGWTVGRLCDVEMGRRAPRSLWWFVPVYVLWTNLHGGMLGGVATIGLAVSGWIVAMWLGWPTPIRSHRQAAEMVAMVIACGLTMFVTPYGARLPQVWFTIMTAGLSNLIIEHMSLWTLWQDETRHEMAFRAASTLFLVAVAYFIALAMLKDRRPRAVWLLPLAWLVLGITSVRHGPLFAVATAVVLADLLPQTRLVGESGWFQPSVDNTKGSLASWAIPALFIAATFGIAIGWRVSGRSDAEHGGCFAQLPAGAWPLDLLPELRRYRRGDARIFNEDLYGGFLMRFAPDVPVFIDDRCEIYGNKALYEHNGQSFLEEYIDALVNHPERIKEWTRRYGLNLALTRRSQVAEGVFDESWFGKYLRSAEAQADGWRVVKEIPGATLFERRQEKTHD
jgi:hypothetical protein